MERLYSLGKYSSSLTWLFSVCLSLLVSQLYWGFSVASGHIFVSGLLLSIAVDQGIDLLPQWTERFRRVRAFNLLKATAFMVLAAPAFALILKGGFLFTATAGLLAFAFTELFDVLKPYMGQISRAQSPRVRQVTPAPHRDASPLNDPLHLALRDHFRGRTILVTGAGRRHSVTTQLASLAPAHMVLIEESVEKLDRVFREIRSKYPQVKVTPHLKIPDHRMQMQHIFERVTPDIILHGSFETNGPILDQNPSFAARVNVIDTIDWIEAARKNGVSEFGLMLPRAPQSSTAQQCLDVVERYGLGLQGESAHHPTRLLILESEEAGAPLASYLHALANQTHAAPFADFPSFLRALHQLEWAVADFNNNEVKALLEAISPTVDEEAALAA